MRGVRLALAIDDFDWHADRLAAAAVAAGVALSPLRLADCGFDTATPSGLALPGFADTLPDAVLVRAIGGGSFEEVTRRLGLLHALRELGVPVLNDARAVERCVDKSATSFLLARAGLPTPASWTVEGRAAAQAIVAREAGAGPLVCKPLFGAQGRGLVLVDVPDALPTPEDVGGVYYLQRFVAPAPGGFRDHRLLVVAGDVVAAMTRRAESWITNLRRGGRAERFAPPAEMRALAVRAAACVGAAIAGADILCDRDGAPWLLEVNSMPGWRGLQDVTDVDLAATVIQAAVAACPRL